MWAKLWHTVNGSCYYVKMPVPSQAVAPASITLSQSLVKELSFSSSSEKHSNNMWLPVLLVLLSSCPGIYVVFLGLHCIE